MGIFVSQLNVYPLKSGNGRALQEAEITATGIKHDRIAMLVHADGPKTGTFVSQRTKGCEILSQVRSQVVETETGVDLDFWLTSDRDLISLSNLPASTDQLSDVRVWGSECMGIDAGEEAASVFSNLVNFPVRLMVYPQNAPRSVDQTYGRPEDITSYADGFPLLITSLPSLQSLAGHFNQNASIGMERFRPNIVLDGNLPWQEDTMHHIRIGEVEIEMVKPCARCVMTTINQVTGHSDETKEPLATLVKFRRGKGEGLQGAFFGQNAIPRTLGTIKVNDEVTILSTRPIHPALMNTVLNPGMM